MGNNITANVLDLSPEKDGQMTFGIISNKSSKTEPVKLRCYKMQMMEAVDLTKEELFTGYDDIEIITFSYDLSMIDWIMQHVKHMRLILGADFIVRSNTANDAVARALSAVNKGRTAVSAADRLVARMKDGDLEVRTSCNIVDHRKIYLLHAADGNVRSIFPSANADRAAWGQNQIETYPFDDTRICYDVMHESFEVSWALAQELPYKAINAKQTDDPLEGNVILKSIQETGQTVILQMPETSGKLITEYKYAIDLENKREQYNALLAGSKLKNDNGKILIKPSVCERVKINAKKASLQKATINTVVENYPKLSIDYDSSCALLNGKPVGKAEEQAIKSDIDILFDVFNRFELFIGEEYQKQQYIYFKMLNVMFASPFIAKLRCELALIGRDGNLGYLPLSMLVASSNPNTGKTFFAKLILKMMTGKDNLTVFGTREYKPSDAIALQAGGCGVPILFDEIGGTFMTTIHNMIKTVGQICEQRQYDKIPLLIFTSNDITAPSKDLRKRMVFLNPQGTIPSDVDEAAWDSRGSITIRKAGNALYSEYLSRMIPSINILIQKMETGSGSELDDEWYPDLMHLSSEALISIIEDMGYPVPEYAVPLSWDKDFTANSVVGDAYKDIQDLYNSDKSAFIINKDTVTIVLGSGTSSKKKMDFWKTTLPPEVLKSEPIYGREKYTITLKRNELEKRSGIRFKHGFFR
ncbi:MAG: hypothetical protein SPL63_12045 [Roseburia faecis]|nr:hypothetical protein [Roseburia faecis]